MLEAIKKKAIHLLRVWAPYLVTVAVAGLILMISFAANHITPFGNRSFAIRDANIQYLDFFAYLKDVMSGNNTIHYSLSNTLGDSSFVIFTYYLSSPLNILVVFFDKSDMCTLLSLLIFLKSIFAAFTFLFFTLKRFPSYRTSRPKLVLSIILAVLFGCSQYVLSQGNNVMWLDGVYMLPLILLGVFMSVNNRGVSRLLVVSVVLSIIFNWYTGAINILFSGIWLFVESAILYITKKPSIKYFLVISLKYFLSVILAIAMSAIILIPTLMSLQSGRGAVELDKLSTSFNGDILGSIQSYIPGVSDVNASHILFVYSGGLVILLIIASLLSKKTSTKYKTFSLIFIVFVLFLFYWKPLFFVFSMLKNADSYYYRYSYVAIFSILFICRFLVEYGKIKKRDIVKGATVFAGILAILQFARTFHPSMTYLYCIFIILLSTLISKSYKAPKYLFATIVLIVFELTSSSILLIRNNSQNNVTEYREYSKTKEGIINAISANDDELYRINETLTRNMSPGRLTANYNESLAYGYNSISGYSSDPDETQRRILDSLGYRKNGDNMNIVNSSIIGADTLLGVKYIISDYDLPGYEEIDYPLTDEIKIYKNKYTLPLFALFNTGVSLEYSNFKNTFEYQNAIFKELSGSSLNIYEPVSFETKYAANDVTVKLHLPEHAHIVYGNIEWKYEFNGQIRTNSSAIDYAKWLSPSVFYVPQAEDTIHISINNNTQDPINQQYYYTVNLKNLEEITKIIQNKAVHANYERSDGRFIIKLEDISKEESLALLSSIPYNTGWRAYINNKKIDIIESEYGFLQFNDIENGELILEYQIPGFMLGLTISATAVLLFVIVNIITKKREV